MEPAIQTDSGHEARTSLFEAIRVFERRRVALAKRIDSRTGSPSSLAYDENEVKAIDVALDAIKLQWSTLRGLDNPILVLEALADAVSSGDHAKIKEVMSRAREVLDEYD